ncbi:type II toxin-antitoxin system VapC family toxin [Cryobacterium fucosi]|uniref:Ribonuclease VapC n=1 Tax=Cryobacterium fucosi TaxID=1259157 RepID=A0A4V3IW28_9MICO|nr:type II toxin-antitoxin system VapC family toxin [Cryobacterium fucosi]TFD82693.1 type II toxin-antitoxin system VapC family toxin [Cryobacterium fucosi]
MTVTRGLIDTSVFVGLETNRVSSIDILPIEQFVSAITLGELLAGVHAATDADTRAARLLTIETVSVAQVLNVDAEVAAHWARLRQKLRENGRRINVNDLWIAATALAHHLPVFTQDADFAVLADLGGPEIITV